MNYSTSLTISLEVYLHAALGLNAQRSIFTQKAAIMRRSGLLKNRLQKRKSSAGSLIDYRKLK